MRKGLMALSVLLMSFVTVFFVLTACEYEPTGVEEPPIVVPEPSADYELNEDDFDLEDDLVELDEDELPENEADDEDVNDEVDPPKPTTDALDLNTNNNPSAFNNTNNTNPTNNNQTTPPAVTVPPVTPPVVNRPPATPPVAPPPPAPVCRDVWVETSPAIPGTPSSFLPGTVYQVIVVMPNRTEFPADVPNEVLFAYMVENNQTSHTWVTRAIPGEYVPGTPAVPAKGHWVQQCN